MLPTDCVFVLSNDASADKKPGSGSDAALSLAFRIKPGFTDDEAVSWVEASAFVAAKPSFLPKNTSFDKNYFTFLTKWGLTMLCDLCYTIHSEREFFPCRRSAGKRSSPASRTSVFSLTATFSVMTFRAAFRGRATATDGEDERPAFSEKTKKGG